MQPIEKLSARIAVNLLLADVRADKLKMSKYKSMYSKRFGMIAISAALDGGSYGNKDKTRINEIDFAPKQPPIPKGCKEYFFNSLGDFLNCNDGVYTFKCVAISDNSAIKKFEKWAAKQYAV